MKFIATLYIFWSRLLMNLELGNSFMKTYDLRITLASIGLGFHSAILPSSNKNNEPLIKLVESN